VKAKYLYEVKILKKLGAVVKKCLIKQWEMVNILENAMMENGPFPLPLKILLIKLIVRDVT